MIDKKFNQFETIYFVDFEFNTPNGGLPEVICIVYHELRNGDTIRLWGDEMSQISPPPISSGKNSLVVAYYASAEMGCYLTLGWPMPANILDLYAEFRVLTNVLHVPIKSSLLAALTHFGIDGIGDLEKEAMRQLARRGGPWTTEERHALLEYCESDVLALQKLLKVMGPKIDLERALLRGRYMKAAAHMEWNGVPMDVDALELLRKHWSEIQDELIASVDKNYGVYEGRTFKADLWEHWLATHRIPWPHLLSGKLALDDVTFKEMARVHPEVNAMRELRTTISKLRLEKLTVGKDGRNRTLISAFRATTGRNQPSNSKFIFGPSVWLRHLIRATPGYGLAYVDYEQQEFGIAAALSNDSAMLDAYSSGDPYLTFAKQAGAAPPNATKVTHGPIREQYKACVLAVQYGMGADSLAARIGKSSAEAAELLRSHRRTYPQFWAWSDAAVDYTMIHNTLYTVFGWRVKIQSGKGYEVNPRSLRNFPMQANGAEMLRLACCIATERGIRICAPIHDAMLIEAPLDELEDMITLTKRAMAEASRIVLNGFELRSDAKVFRYPDHYHDERGEQMWSLIRGLIREKSAHLKDLHHTHEVGAPQG